MELAAADHDFAQFTLEVTTMKIEKNVLLEKFTTFRVGGPAKEFVEVSSIEELSEAVAYARKNNLKIFILGGGSNVLISDKGFEGLVIHITFKGISYVSVGEKVRVTAMGGLDWDDLVSDTVSRGLYGLENLSGIPGSVGAAPVQNIGAYGGELKDVLLSLEIFDTETLEAKSLSAEECRFGYRDSLFKKEQGHRLVVTSITLELKKTGPVNITYRDLAQYFSGKESQPLTAVDVREAVLSIRKNKLPDVKTYGTAGSFFKNPIVSIRESEELRTKFPEMPSYKEDDGRVKIPAAWLIDRVCNLKDFRSGDVGTYPKQPLAIVNYGGASASEISQFAQTIQKSVSEKTGINLEWEVAKIGKFD